MHRLKSQKKKFVRQSKKRLTLTIRNEGKKKKRIKPKAPKKLNTSYAFFFLDKILSDTVHNVPSYTLADYTRDSTTILRRLKSEGVGFVTKTLPGFCQSFFELLETGAASFPSWKIKRGRPYPVFLQGLTSEVYLARHSMEQNENDVKAFKAIYQLCVAFKKIKGPYSHKVLLKKYTAFVETDVKLGRLKFSVSDPILKKSVELMAEFLKTVDLEDVKRFIPRPGPGATNTPTKKHERFEPHVLYHQIHRTLPYDEWFYSHPWDVVDQSRNFLEMYKNSRLFPTSRFKYVPKKVDDPRGICIEENEVQFLQQAFRRGLQYFIAKDELMSKRIVFNDQSVNANLALEASATQEWATLDWSEASDRVARELVRLHFSSHPELCEVLMALSTRFITPPEFPGMSGKIPESHRVPLMTNKFAPMGSALCFPVMSLIHFCLIRAVILCSNMQDRKNDSRNVWVYGDDIVLPSLYSESVMETLQKYGLKPNKNKSFYRSYFRESCGIHAYKGVDVTPVYVKHTPNHRTFESLLSCLANESDLYKKGFRATALFLRENMLKAFSHLHLHDAYVPHTYPLIAFKRECTDPYCFEFLRSKKYKCRWNDQYQSPEYRIPVIRKRNETTNISRQDSALLRWYSESSRGRYHNGDGPDADFTEVRGSSGDLRIVWTWYPITALPIKDAGGHFTSDFTRLRWLGI